MMNFHIDGLDRLSVSYASLSRISDDDLWAIIEPAANTLRDRMKESITRLFRQRTGSLRESIEVKRKTAKSGAIFALVGPNQKEHSGQRGRRASAFESGSKGFGKRKSRAQGGKGGSYSGTNAEVGWILEYGTSRIPGRHWMEQAVTATEEEIHEMLDAGFNAACEAVGL